MSPARSFPRALVSSAVLLAVLACPAGAWAADAGHATKPAAKAEKAATEHGDKSAKPTAKASAKDDTEALQRLRERLAAKLGAEKAPEGRNTGVVRVVSRSAEEHESAAPSRKAAPRPAAGAAHAAARPAAGGAADGHAPHWSYSGEVGPKAWGGLRPEFIKCGTGTRQSPIDIRGGIAVDLEPVQFDYRAGGFSVIDNGHTVQVNLEPGNSIVARGERYDLVQFHFHRPSEERIDGRIFDMVVHLVHKDPEGRLAVVAVLLDRGSAQPIVQTVWNNLPLEKHQESPARAVLDLNHLLPADRGYYTYMGSLTTPPCTEGVLWMVMRQPVAVSPEQIEIFSRLYPMNARPVQQAAGRMIKQSN
jgi:carbonic anhydrase